ncbi:MAG: hypothetical protein P8180_09440 [Gammaproteobacteria bacterium]|jgi:mono/diheme cytochrome c family protein
MRYLAWTLVGLVGLGCLAAAGCKGGRGDSAPQVAPATDPTVTPDSFLTFMNTSLAIDSDAYADAYYARIDPNNKRTTLADWKAENGFQNGFEVHATFRDAKDLGYGRDMYARHRSDGGVAIYVNNYLVELEPGDATSYGPLNLDAAINQDQRYLIGTNAIEFSPDPQDTSHRIAKFFTFGTPDANGVQHRMTAIDIDGRGVKHMPTACLVCHGGTMYPVDGSFDPISVKSPKLHMIEQDTLQFSALTGFRESDQQAAIKTINEMVYESWREQGTRPDAVGDQANWSSTLAETLMVGAYGGDPTSFAAVGATGLHGPSSAAAALPSTYQAGFVPEGWRQTPSRPDGVELLYKRVIAPHCMGCHALRGTRIADENTDAAGKKYPNAVNFTSYESFAAEKDRIIDYVYKRGAMPASLINYTDFWKDPQGAPTLLATYLPGFNVFDASGNVVEPGKPVAKPGADRTVTSPVTLDASASLFTASYAWRIVSTPPGATANLSSTTSVAPVLTADTDGAYTIELVTSNARASSDPAQVTITVDSALSPSQTTVNFVNDVKAVLQTSTKCIQCHTSSVTPGIPIYYDDADYTDLKGLYRNVLKRVDLNDPENSLLLRKPTGLIHGGGVQLNATDYNTILNWIRAGAPCGSNPAYCD